MGPLRLLAFEIQENLKAAGIKCSMVTGEERKIVVGASHISSTVEMLNLKEYYDVAVIDECQMISDKWRGGHWVKAILGVLSEEVHLCTAPEALDLLKSLIELCGDSYEVIEHKRTVPLVSSSVLCWAKLSFQFLFFRNYKGCEIWHRKKTNLQLRPKILPQSEIHSVE